jgi:hypothetical protein
VLALMLNYIAVGGAEIVESYRERRPIWAVTCALGPLLLAWVLFRNVYPVPEYPNNLWPYVTAAWIAGAWIVMALRPAVARAPLPEYF